jgi:hypothetical protein
MLVKRSYNCSLILLRDGMAQDDEIEFGGTPFYRLSESFSGHYLVSGHFKHRLSGKKQ